MRRDLFGPHPQLDTDLEREVLQDKPSRFYVGGFIVPAYDGGPPPAQDEDEEAEKVADDLLAGETLDSPTEPEADEQETPDQPPKDRTPDGRSERLRIVTAFVVNRRKRARAPYGDLAYAFQVRLELSCPTGFLPRHDVSTYHSDDPDLRLADLHYRDVCEYAVGRNTSGGWEEHTDGNGQRLPVTRVWTDPMPQQEVEKVA